MTLTFVVRNQTLLYIDTKVIPRIGSAKYLELKFKFITKDWTNLRKTLHISVGEYSEPFVLQSDTFQVPTYYTQQSAFSITLLGDSDDGVVVPTNEVSVALDESNTLWTAVPPDPQNSAYLELLKSVVPSDWNQNDPTAKDYIKNRTHYVSQENKVIAPEQEVTTAVQNNFNIAILNGVDFDTFKTLFNSEDNTTFDVVFDGASYPCKWLEQNGVRIPGFGNLAIIDSSLTDTGEPFCISLGEKSGARDILVVGCKVAGTHTVAVSYSHDVVHTLDPKYIGHIEPGMIGDISDGILTINHATEFAKESWASDYSYFEDNWLPMNFGADISLEINGKLFEHLPFSSGPYGAFSYGDVSTIGVAIVNSGRGSSTQSVNVSKVMFPDGVTSAKVYRTIPLRIPDGAVPEKAEWVLNHSAEDFVGNQDAAFVRRFGITQVAKPNSSNSDVVFNTIRHGMLLISTPRGESYYDVMKKNSITCNDGTSNMLDLDVHLPDGTLVTSSDWPLGCTLIGTDFSGNLYLLNPRVTK